MKRRVFLGVLCGAALSAGSWTQVSAGVAVLARTVTVDPEAAVAGTLEVPAGSRVRLTVEGAGAGEVHLHAFGIEAQAVEGVPLVLAFATGQAGRFPVEMHVDDPLLGRREKAILFIEVRAP